MNGTLMKAYEVLDDGGATQDRQLVLTDEEAADLEAQLPEGWSLSEL